MTSLFSNEKCSYFIGRYDDIKINDTLYYTDKNIISKITIVDISIITEDVLTPYPDGSFCYYFEPRVNNNGENSWMISSYFDMAVKYHSFLNEDGYRCPEDGSFIAYKQVAYDQSQGWSKTAIAVLEIPGDAKRLTAKRPILIGNRFSYKCRADKAKVLRIESVDGNNTYGFAYSKYRNQKFEYKVGEMVYADDFDPDPEKDCSHGIHFFMKREDAVEY